MKRDLASCANQCFDILIIGGGIFGAGVARDAALRGMRVALIDKGDFASGTSSRSSKLIHGGFRYLEQFAFGLVAEACCERQVLQTIAPHLVHPQPFLFPVYKGDPRSLVKLRVGMTLYDLMSRSHNVSRHQALSTECTLTKEPALARSGMRGSVLFYDCQEDDARLCIETISHAAHCGAVCNNYCELTGFIVRENRITAARVMDQLGSGEDFEIAARVFINAAGPWVQSVAKLSPIKSSDVGLSPTKGVHVLLPRLTQQHAIAFQSRRDGRIMFIIPWGDCSIVGTTDTDWRGDPAEVRAEPADVEYLLHEVRSILPDSPAKLSDVITTFAGVRALVRSDKSNPSNRPREHRVMQHGENLLSIVGGKYTTHRAIAQEVVDKTCELLGQDCPPCLTATSALPQRRPTHSGQRISIVPDVFGSDITHACEDEMAMTVSDVMRRRTSLALSKHGGPETAASVAKLMVAPMRWSNEQMNQSLQEYVEEWKRALP
jgi:glycerol-3-phosphate dehydrogenase